MGRDKALVEVEGIAMVVRVATALRAAGCEPVFAVGGDQRALEALGVQSVADGFPGEGPVGGVISAFEACHPSEVVVVACDLPYLTADTLRAVIAGRGSAQASVAFTGRVQPLCVVWSRPALDTIRGVFATGERRLGAVLEQLRTIEVAVNPQDLANVNTPDDVPQ